MPIALAICTFQRSELPLPARPLCVRGDLFTNRYQRMTVFPDDTITTTDDRGLHCRTYGPETAQMALVVVHGLGEHSGCYEEFGQRMAEQGVSTLAYDQQGHGKSPGRRGDARSFDMLVDDIAVALSAARVRYPDAELILLGHSMGGNLVLNHLLGRDCPLVLRAIVTNPMILPPDPPTRPQAFVAWLTTKIVPHLRLSAGIDPTQLTRDEAVLAELANDPLIHEQLSIELGGQLLAHGHWLMENADKLSRPLLLLKGSDDELCDADSTNKFVDQAGEFCQRIDFPGLRHNLLLERDREPVYEAIFRWLEIA